MPVAAPQGVPAPVPAGGRPAWATLALRVCVVIAVVFGGYELLERLWLLEYAAPGVLHWLHLARGTLSTMLVAWLVAAHLLRRSESPYAADRVDPSNPGSASEVEADAQRRRVSWIIRLRWLAVVAVAATSVLATRVVPVLEPGAFAPLLVCVVLLIAANTCFSAWSHRRTDWRRQLLVQMSTDVVLLTGLLHFSGGIDNPFHPIYAFHVIIAAIVLGTRMAYRFAIGSWALLLAASLGRAFGWIEGVSCAWTLPVGPEGMGAWAGPVGSVLLRMTPLLGILMMTAYLTSVIIEQLRRRERQLELAARDAAEERAKLEKVVRATGLGLLVLEPSLNVVWSNERASEWFGLDGRVGQLCRICSPVPGMAPSCSACANRACPPPGQFREWEIERLGSHEETLVYRAAATMLAEEAEGRNLTLLVVQDVTARKQAENEVIHATKMAAIGRVASGVAHEIGNPLASLSTRLDLMERRRDDTFTRESLGVIREQIRRINRIVRGVSQFARASKPEWSVCSVSAILQETIEVARLDPRARQVRFEFDAARALPETWCVKDQITQVCLNLLLNAVEAMPDGGVVEILPRVERENIVVEVRDEGTGIAAGVRERISRPFFTTKAGGSGLGLSISRQLVEAHGGELSFGNRESGGASFVFTLPIRARQDEPSFQEWEG